MRLLWSDWHVKAHRLQQPSRTGGFQDCFYWTAIGWEAAEEAIGQGEPEGAAAGKRDGRQSRHHEHRMMAWNQTMHRLQHLYSQNR